MTKTTALKKAKHAAAAKPSLYRVVARHGCVLAVERRRGSEIHRQEIVITHADDWASSLRLFARRVAHLNLSGDRA